MPQTGPKSLKGKKLSSLNSIKHGINIKGFLPCKKHSCYFFNLCILKDQNGFTEIDFGGPCPVEIAKYDLLLEGYVKSLPSLEIDKAELIHELIMLRIRQDRQLMLAAVEADITREVSGSNHSGLALNFRYRSQIKTRLYQVLNLLSSPEKETKV